MSTVNRLDPTDPSVFAEFYDAYARAFNRDFDQPYTAAELAVDMVPDEYNGLDRAGGARRRRRGRGGAWAELPQKDNLTFAYAEVFVVPERRREGHGSVLAEALMAECRDAGRKTMLGEALWAVDDEDGPATKFAEQLGFELDIMDAHRELSPPGQPAAVGDRPGVRDPQLARSLPR